MPSFETRRVVPYTPTQMFDVIADIEQYPKYLPLCEGLTINTREVDGDTTTLNATMDVGYKAIRESFTTKVELQPNKPRIDVEYLDGPFSHLTSVWKFNEHATGCEVDFFIDYEFRSPFLALLMGGVFEKAFRKFAQSFEDRAREIYSQPKRTT